MVYKISGAFFFRATARVLTVLERLGATPRLLVLDFAEVPLIDTAAARSLVAFVNKSSSARAPPSFSLRPGQACVELSIEPA